MPRKTPSDRYRLRHARRIARFFQQANSARTNLAADERHRQIAPHSDDWHHIVETHNPPRSAR